MRKIVEAEILSSDGSALRITLSNGEIIEGYSWGIMPEFDDDGKELDYDILAFKMYAPAGYCHLRDEDIAKVEKTVRLWAEESAAG